MTIFGWDASHYDQVPDGARVVAEGFSFMTHKAGGDQDDAELGAWWRAMKPYRDRILLGAYWIPYPGWARARAQAFLDRLDSQCPGWRDGPFLLQLDCEIWNGNPSTQPGRGDIRAGCDYLKRAVPKLTPVVYASKGQYGNSLAGLGYPLWNANYPSSMTGPASAIYAHVGGDSGPGWGAYSGQTPALWQFTSSATIAGQTTCDANAYRGTLAALVALVAPGWAVPDMTQDEMLALLQSDAGQAAIAQAAGRGVHNQTLGKSTTTFGVAVQSTYSTVGTLPTAKATADAVLGELAGRSVPEIAAALKAVLGDQAAAVGAALQA